MHSTNSLSQSCNILPGVGPALAKKLSLCGIHTVADLLFHLPFRYQDRTRVTPIDELRPQDFSVIIACVAQVDVQRGHRSQFSCYVEDKTGQLKLRFFHFNQHQVNTLVPGQWLRAFGEVRQSGQHMEMIHPEYQLLEHEQDCVVEDTLTPIYPKTSGLTQNRLRNLIQITFTDYPDELTALEWLSENELVKHGFPSFQQALQLLHTPPPQVSLQTLETGNHPACQRLIFDELLAQQISMEFARQQRQALIAPAMPRNDKLKTQFLTQLPFQLTAAQEHVSHEIAQDMTTTQPMLRLLQGDVGSGKTIVAAMASLQAISAGFQVALMAPTELLSEQHAINFNTWLNPLGITCQRLSGKMKADERQSTLNGLRDKTCSLVIGTHALFQDDVEFSQLGLVIIDEQHRFGVEQRLMLQQKGQHSNRVPHQLLMTATPIPRTLAMSHFAHLDLSIINELPPGRTPVTTAISPESKREQLIARIQLAINHGRQAYWVCPLIEESEKLQCMAATSTAQALQTKLPEAKIGLIHGRMNSIEKDTVMTQFKTGEINLLVATTVIEVGVDVPNASLMIIEDAQRLGLSQLHQLRGRVGRGNQQSYCLLLYQSPLSTLAAERLRIIRGTCDGFLIAEKDLELRGAGEFLGVQQAGYKTYKLADMQRDQHLLPLVTQYAKQLVDHSPKVALCIARRWLGEFEPFLHG